MKKLSMAATALKAQPLPQLPWFFTGVTLPAATQSMTLVLQFVVSNSANHATLSANLRCEVVLHKLLLSEVSELVDALLIIFMGVTVVLSNGFGIPDVDGFTVVLLGFGAIDLAIGGLP
jgi:hypothetical protein